MFRELRRFKQQISEEECAEVLEKQLRGVLAVQGDDGYPYAFPINHWYCKEDGKIYFHSGPGGHKLDSIARDDKVSFCVYDEGFRKEGDWALNIKSVIVFGRAKIVEDREKCYWISRNLSYKFGVGDDYVDEDIKKNGAAVVCIELTPEKIIGKLVNES